LAKRSTAKRDRGPLQTTTWLSRTASWWFGFVFFVSRVKIARFVLPSNETVSLVTVPKRVTLFTWNMDERGRKIESREKLAAGGNQQAAARRQGSEPLAIAQLHKHPSAAF
jgi:hypothetical protein